MLRELRNTRQIDGEPPRKWYFAKELDLVVWFDASGVPNAFQLAYDKSHGEHAISWHHRNGYRHYVVDDGEGIATSNATPLLFADGPLRKTHVLDSFIAAAGELPQEIRDFVIARLRLFDGPVSP